MGSVWLARHTELDVPCAVKFIQADDAADPMARARFAREARAAAQLRSPHVVQVLDHGLWGETPFLAMELLEGEDLRQRLKQQGRLAPKECVGLIAQVARGLSKAHGAGIVHRDLKPENLFLVVDEDREIVKILDFGLAKEVARVVDGKGSPVTRSGAMLGTPFYMSPEQLRCEKDIDGRSDVWALGVIVFECLVGRRPFVSDSIGNLVMAIMAEPLPVPSEIVAELPPAFDAWWERAAQRDPGARFQTARELADALAAAFGLPADGAIGSPRSLALAAAQPASVAPTGPGYEPTATDPQGAAALAPTSAAPATTPAAVPWSARPPARAAQAELLSTGGLGAQSSPTPLPTAPRRPVAALAAGALGLVALGALALRAASGAGAAPAVSQAPSAPLAASAAPAPPSADAAQAPPAASAAQAAASAASAPAQASAPAAAAASAPAAKALRPGPMPSAPSAPAAPATTKKSINLGI